MMKKPVNPTHLGELGWVRIDGVIPAELCQRLIDALDHELGVPIGDRAHWDAYGDEMRDLVPIWGHQAQWDIR